MKRVSSIFLVIAIVVSSIFASDILQKESFSSVNAKSEWSCKESKKVYKDSKKRVRGIVSYQYPKFTGNSKAIKKINADMRKQCKKFMKSSDAKSIKESVNDAIKNKQFIDVNNTYEHYYYESTFEITYEKDNIICISTSYNWYADGAPYYGKKNYTYNMKTGKKLTYKDVISGNAKKKIIKKCEEMFKDTWDYEEVMKKVKKKKSYQFYLKDGKVYVCFERGELVYNGAPEIEFETKYK